MEPLKTARNVAIVVAIAAGVYFLPGGGRAASTFEAVLWVAFGIGIAYFGVRMYRENRVALHGLGDRHRALLYGALAGVVFLLDGAAADVEYGHRRAGVVRAGGAGSVCADGHLPPLALVLTAVDASYPRMGWQPPKQ